MPSSINPFVLDWQQLSQAFAVDIPATFQQLQQLYTTIDERAASHHARLQLPCKQGCDACCHQSVFLTPLEFFYAWDQLQQQQPVERLSQLIQQGLRLYWQFETEIKQLLEPIPPGEQDHFAIARRIAFRCPMLDTTGSCMIYAQRELLARAFGCSFTRLGQLYGCNLTQQHLANQTVTLLNVHEFLDKLHQLPLTHIRQVYPYYFHLCFADVGHVSADGIEEAQRSNPLPIVQDS